MFRSTQPPPEGSKRSRDEESKEKNKSIEEGKKNNNNYPLLRDRYDCIHYMSLDYEFTFNPPEIGQFLTFLLNERFKRSVIYVLELTKPVQRRRLNSVLNLWPKSLQMIQGGLIYLTRIFFTSLYYFSRMV